MKRALIIGAVVVVLGGIGVGVYLAFFGSDAGVEVAPSGDTNLPVAGGAVTPANEEPVVSGSPEAPAPVSNRLVKISKGPVVPGAAVVSRPATASSSSETKVTFIERQSGNVFSYDVLTQSLTRISNRTVPGIQSAVWLPDASLAFVRYLSGADFSTVNTYGLRSDGGEGFFLAQNLASVAISSSSVLALASGVNGSSASVTRADGTSATEAFTTPLSSLRASFAGKGQYLAFTKPSSTVLGAAYLVSAGSFSRIAGPLYGLVALASPSGKWVLISYSGGGVLKMQLVNTATGEALPLPVATIADKCVWAHNDSSVYCGVPMTQGAGRYPDDWYQGAVSFSDRIWRIQVDGRYAQFMLDFPTETGEELDAVSLTIDSLSTALVFMNKKDGSLWVYSL